VRDNAPLEANCFTKGVCWISSAILKIICYICTETCLAYWELGWTLILAMYLRINFSGAQRG